MRQGCPGCRVIGVDPAAGILLAPPGVDAVEQVPSPDTEGFVAAVLDVATRHGLSAVLPWTDRDALALAPGRDRFERAGIAVVCPPGELVELACDKWATRQRLDGLGVLVPDARLVHDGAQLLVAARDLGYPAWGLMFKPRHLAGGRGVWRVSAVADPVASGPYPTLPVEAMAVLLDRGSPSVAGRGYVLEQEVVGVDTSVDVLAYRGELLSVVTRTRQTTLGGLSVAGCVVRPSGGVRDMAETVVAGLAWSGLANIQVMEPPAGPPVVYEINPRAAGSIGLAAYAGVDLLSAAIDLARHGHLPADLPSSVTTTVRFRRYWLDQAWTVAPAGPAPAPAAPAIR